MGNQLDRLVLEVPPPPEHRSCAEVYDRFASDVDLLTLAMTRGHEPVGIVNRHKFLFHLAHGFGRALYEKKPISELMDTAPLIVDVTTSLLTLNYRKTS